MIATIEIRCSTTIRDSSKGIQLEDRGQSKSYYVEEADYTDERTVLLALLLSPSRPDDTLILDWEVNESQTRDLLTNY